MDALRPFFASGEETMKFTTRKIALCGITAGLYAAITLLTSSFAFGPVQFRVAEALAVLCCFEPSAVLGVTLGCFIANVFSTVSALDMVVGTVATLLACLCMTKAKKAWQAVWPNVVFNGVFIGALIAYVTVSGPGFWAAFAINGLQVAAGELAVMLLLGMPLFAYLKKSDLVRRLTTE